MFLPASDHYDEQVRIIVNKVSNVYFSDEFSLLKSELEKIYAKSGVENPTITAFQDALYALLSQQEDILNSKSRAH